MAFSSFLRGAARRLFFALFPAPLVLSKIFSPFLSFSLLPGNLLFLLWRRGQKCASLFSPPFSVFPSGRAPLHVYISSPPCSLRWHFSHFPKIEFRWESDGRCEGGQEKKKTLFLFSGKSYNSRSTWWGGGGERKWNSMHVQYVGKGERKGSGMKEGNGPEYWHRCPNGQVCTLRKGYFVPARVSFFPFSWVNLEYICCF